MKKKIASTMLLTLSLMGMLALAFAVQPVESSLDVNACMQATVVEHEITPFELERLKQQIGVCVENRDYNQVVDGYGTGLRPPTEEKWVDMLSSAYVVERILLNEPFQAPSSVDHSASPWFPPIGNQDGEGSCTAWAVGYYTKTFQEAYEHGWNLSQAEWEGGYYGHPTPEFQDQIVSPDFIYHLINGGVDLGSSFYDAISLVCAVGASSWEKMPYDPLDHTSWPSEEAWREAPLFRGGSSGYEWMWIQTNDDVVSLRNWLASDHLATIAVDADQYYSLTSEDIWTLDNYVNPWTNHANTIVGYDDTIEYFEDGEWRHGAFKIANSWGEGGWEKIPDGCYWISYEAMKQRVEYCMFYQDRTGYTPELFASFRVDHSKRDECDILLGIGSHGSPDATKWFSQYVDGGYHAFCPNNIVLDVTEFKDAVPTVYNKMFFLRVNDGGSVTTGTILHFAINYAVSEDPPISTVQGSYVFADVVLGDLAISIYTDKNTYHTSDTMHLGLDTANPGSAATVCLAIWIEKPDDSIKVIQHHHSVTLPTGLEYTNPNFITFTLPHIPSGDYIWHAALTEPTTHDVIIEDTAEWEFS